MNNISYNLYPEIEPYQSGWLEVSDIHQIYYEQCGKPDGKPVVFLHGGPGSGCNANQRRFFDPAHYRIILLDQRGCGRSKPLGNIVHNTTDELVADIDALRRHLNIERWLVFGGSWGSTLALAYALRHSLDITGLILRGIFLSRTSELRWFLHDARRFFPEAWEKLLAFIPSGEQGDMLAAYAKRVFADEPTINIPAAISWNAYEGNIMTLRPTNGNGSPASNEVQLARARVQLHYIMHGCFVEQRDLLGEAAAALTHLPTIIVQGRYDMVCPPLTAWELRQVLPQAELHMIADAGHSAMEAGTSAALIAATEKFKILN